MSSSPLDHRVPSRLSASGKLDVGVLCADPADFKIRQLLGMMADDLPFAALPRVRTDPSQCRSLLHDAGPSIWMIDDRVGIPAVAEAVRGIRDTSPRCAAIVLTSSADLELHDRYLDYGSAEILLWEDATDGLRAGFNVYRAIGSALERATARADLRVLGRRFDTAWRNCPAPYFRVEGGGHLIACNRPFAELLGFGGPDELIGRPLHEVTEDVDSAPVTFRSSVEPETRICRLQTRQGDPIQVRLIDYVAPGPHYELDHLARIGGPLYRTPVREGFLQVDGDLEDDLRRQLGRYEALYSSLFAAMAEGFVIADARGRVRSANAAAESLLGFRLADVHGRHLDDVFLRVEADREDVSFSEVYDGEERLLELRRGAEEGSGDRETVWVRVRALLVEIPGGREPLARSQFLISLIDESSRVEAERRASRAELGSQIASGVSHDMRNFLTAIASSAGLMRRLIEGRDQRLLEYAEQIEQVALSSAGLLDQGLQIVRSQVRAERQPVAVDAVLRGIERLLRSLITRRIGLSLDLDAAGAEVESFRGAVEQIVINLLLNARDAVPGDEGRIELRTRCVDLAEDNRFVAPPARYLEISVVDTGTGIRPEIRERIFDPFFTDREGGTGLGLAMVQELVRELGGEVSYDTEIGEGTTFRVFLPLLGARSD